MRIVTWNLKHGTGSALWPRLQASLGAELVLLQEARRPDWRGARAWESVEHRDWGSAVLAIRGELRAIPIPGYDGWVVGGELIDSGLNSPDRSLFAFSVHAPTGNPGRPRRSYIDEVVNVLDLIGQVLPTNAELVVGGDFNFKSLGHRREGEVFDTTSSERDALERFAGMGLVSCWAVSHPERGLAQTLRWSGDKTPDKSTPYHCDAIFVPSSWQPGISCEVLTSTCFEVSDHYPVATWISR